MTKLLNVIRVLCIVITLLVFCSGLVFTMMGKPVPLTILQRLGIALPLLAIFNYITVHLRKKALPSSPSETIVSPK